jgi:hypothetical protein
MENKPTDIKLSLSQRIFEQNQKKNQILNLLYIHCRMGKQTIIRYCPFKVSKAQSNKYCSAWLAAKCMAEAEMSRKEQFVP